MNTHDTPAQLFDPPPRQWGLRGDPYLWNEIQACLVDCAYPASEAVLIRLLEQAYHQLTGTALTNSAPVFVERYSHGGMSSGYVSPQFWLETAFPLLRSRYRDST